MEATVYNSEGKESGKIKLSDQIFGLKWNADLVDQVIYSMRSNRRPNIADTKDRSEVRGGGKKPWRQKGTGRARHGSSRSPIWAGGGVTHGPTSERNYDKKINKKMKSKALATILSAKFKDGELAFVEEMNFSAPGTKTAQKLVNNLAKVAGYEKLNYRTGKRVLIIWPGQSQAAERSFRNIPSALWKNVMDVSPVETITYKYVVVVNPAASLEKLTERLTSKK